MDCDYALVVLKGMIEKNDPGAYFGSTMALHYWAEIVRERGWVDGEYAITPLGRAYYKAAGLDRLPVGGRGYMWDWSVLGPCEDDGYDGRGR